jgi:hypothetical protein
MSPMKRGEVWSADESARTDPVEVSLVRLIADPERYRGRLVRVIGYLEFAFEGNALYIHGDDALFSISANAVAVDATRDMYGSRKALSGYALLEAVFDPDSTGHRGVFSSGGLVCVQRCESWPPDCLRTDKPE